MLKPSTSDMCQSIIERHLDGDANALNELVEHIEGMIKSIISKFYHGTDLFMDMYQTAWVAVMKCVQMYDRNSGTKFTSYAYRAIQNELILFTTQQHKHKSKYDDNGQCIRGFIPLESEVSNKQYDGTYLEVKDTISDATVDIERTSIYELCTPIVYEVAQSFTNNAQRTMILRYLNGDRQQDIAWDMDVTPAYVSKTIRVFNERCQLILK